MSQLASSGAAAVVTRLSPGSASRRAAGFAAAICILPDEVQRDLGLLA